MDTYNTKPLHIHQGTVSEKRSELKSSLLKTIEIEESLYSLLKSDDSFYEKPIPLRHPLIFYYGHTFTFFINKLYNGNFITKRINPHLESMHAIGVDEMSWDDLTVTHYKWKSVSEVKNYRAQVTELLCKYIDTVDFTLPITWDSPIWPILMGIEHLRIHIETSSVLIRQLSLDHIKESPQWAPCPHQGTAPKNELINFKGGEIQLGKTKDSPYYAWDNEFGKHKAKLNDFKASKFLVSNAEFLEFVQDEGYTTDDYWTDEGVSWKHFTKALQPSFWIKDKGQYLLRVLDRIIKLPLNWPVEVNQLEAKAFCNWKSEKENKNLRLISEDEWSQVYSTEVLEHKKTRELKNETASDSTHSYNMNLSQYRSPCPIDEFKAKSLYDVMGNVWQWTETPIYAFDDFKVHPLYDDFSVPTFDTRHNIFKGGSWISMGNLSLPDSRYAFRRHFFQHAGFRYVESTNPIINTNNPYETDSQLSQYCEFHFGKSYFDVPNFPKACIDECAKYFSDLPQRHKALDLGCAVGRSTFELSKYFDHVTGIDFSARFIQVAQRFIENKMLKYTLPTEGELLDYHQVSLSSFSWSENLTNKVSFYQGDACNLPEKFGGYDFIFCGNLIDRLHSPQSFLTNIHKYLNDEGLLIITSPYTWLEEHTPKSQWIGGKKIDGKPLKTLDGLKNHLAPWFKMIGGPTSIPFVIRETQRKYQHTLSEMSVWKKKI